MATDFQLIEAYDADIESFSYDISDMVDSIYIGPQGELLEKLERFNHTYDTSIGVTKNFTLKPGGYDEIKKAHARWVLRYDMKPRGIKSLFDRMQQYSWRAQNFKRDTLDIETQMKNLKSSGMRWQDNTDQFEGEFNRLKDSIINSLDQTKEMYPGIDISCKVIPVNEGRLQMYRRRGYHEDRQCFPANMFSDNVVDFVLMLYIKIKSSTMSVHIMDDDGTAEYDISMGDILIASGTYLLPLISRHWGRTTPITTNAPSNQYSFFLEAMYLSEMGKSEHPYIGRSTDKYMWELGGRAHSGNICTGNMAGDIRNSLINNEIMAHIVQLITWVTTYYVPQTNPLNRINRLRSYGDDIKFVQWRSDLNSTSERVFTSGRDNLPEDCNFGSSLLAEITRYASNEDYNSMYNDRSLRFNENDVEWPVRLHEYLSLIALDDMPCNNCSFKSECNQWHVLQLIFQDSLTPEEEAYFGMLYEYHEYNKNILSRGRNNHQNYREVYYAEMAVEEAWRWKLDKEHFTMVMSHKMCIWWSHLNDETFSTTNHTYRSRMYALHRMNGVDHRHLFEHHYLNGDSEMLWTLDNIRAYHAPSPDDRLDWLNLLERYEKRQREMADENLTMEGADEAMREWLESNNDEDLPFTAPNIDRPTPVVEEDMTPEQRTIQWAIQHGGANNL